MLLENIFKFLKKNGVLLIQIGVLSLPFVIFAIYFSMSENADTVDVASLETVIEIAPKSAESEKEKTDEKKEEKNEQQSSSASTFEVDEVSQDMLDKSAGNPKEMLAGSGACTNFENVHTIAKHTGTISKAKNIEHFKKLLPAMITETEYTCVDAKGAKQTKFTTMGVGVDAEANLLRCIQSTSDETMDSEARFNYVLKTMTHHCGFKLSEHQPISTGKQP
ncbi:MAG: hypothetical protein PHN45_12100 [Methylococcales bacterium]|nr:hypothetical protein [Methylococcales bacterium]MDD5755476.1 hypothetical protein [Methylococcales bacterium]